MVLTTANVRGSCTLACFTMKSMTFRIGSGLFCSLLMLAVPQTQTAQGVPKSSPGIFGFRNAAAETEQERRFLAIPDPKLADQHLRVLTQAPHVAGSPEDKATA